jgi:hypothetical protein
MIIHHLLINGEDYVEDGFAKLPNVSFKPLARIPLEEMVAILRGAGYVVLAPS